MYPIYQQKYMFDRFKRKLNIRYMKTSLNISRSLIRLLAQNVFLKQYTNHVFLKIETNTILVNPNLPWFKTSLFDKFCLGYMYIVITSDVCFDVIVVFVDADFFLQMHLLHIFLTNHLTNCNQTCYKASLGEWILSLKGLMTLERYILFKVLSFLTNFH